MSYKILSLDGGGSWALIQARILQDIYGDIQGHELLRKFDLVIANSGGSLVLACLCNNMRLSEIISVFKTESKRKKIFVRLKANEHSLLSLARSIFKSLTIGPKYSAAKKRSGLVDVLSEYDHHTKIGLPIVKTPISKLPKIIGKESLQIVIVAFDYFKERATFFRSNKESKTDKFNKKYYDVTLGDAIHASSNAPVNYFQEYAKVDLEYRQLSEHEKKLNWYWDGAVAGFNNPVLAGLIEAMTNEPNRPLEDFKILSIGTGQKGKTVIVDQKYSEGNPVIVDRYKKNKDKKYILSNDSRKFKLEIAKMAQSILSDPPDSATFIAYSILNRGLENNANLVRINPCVTPQLDKASNEYILPDAYKMEMEKFMDILDLDMDAVEDKQVDLIADLAEKFVVDDPAAPYVPNQFIRGENESDAKLGFGSYREAKKRWLEIGMFKTGENKVIPQPKQNI